MTFNDLNLNTPLYNAIDDLGFSTPTPIQAESFNVVASGKDVVGIAGFFLNNDGDMHSFVFIMNGKNAKKAQPFIDDLIGLNY